jgi:hypothetical protein
MIHSAAANSPGNSPATHSTRDSPVRRAAASPRSAKNCFAADATRLPVPARTTPPASYPGAMRLGRRGREPARWSLAHRQGRQSGGRDRKACWRCVPGRRTGLCCHRGRGFWEARVFVRAGRCRVLVNAIKSCRSTAYHGNGVPPSVSPTRQAGSPCDDSPFSVTRCW